METLHRALFSVLRDRGRAAVRRRLFRHASGRCRRCRGSRTHGFHFMARAAPSFPIALLLALARQGRLPAVGTAAAIYIDLVRGIPLIVILFLSATVVPLMLPSDLVVAKVLRASICITLFAAAFLAEVIRGGLQSLPKGQYQAADALGLRYWQAQFLIVLPQIIPVIARPASGIYITLFKNTSLISVIGLFEITGIASIVSSKPEWSPFSTEIYVVVGAVYVLFCSVLSSLSSSIERQFDRTRRA